MIAIKNIKMPMGCKDCKFNEKETFIYICHATGFVIDGERTDRPKFCPLVEVK